MGDECINKHDAIDIVEFECGEWSGLARTIVEAIEQLPPAQPERLTDDDFETIRIHLNAYKEELCNQRRWKEAGEYQRIIDRFMEFASAQPETAKRIVGKSKDGMTLWYQCDMCNEPVDAQDNFCRGCGRRLTDG